MDNQDKLFEQIKSAAENAETKDFPGMEKVWSRVDAKLDTKAHQSQNKLWQKIAVAASILLTVSIGYQFFKEDKNVVTPKNEVVTTDSTLSATPNLKADTTAIVLAKPEIKENANKILEKQIATQNQVTYNYSLSTTEESGSFSTDTTASKDGAVNGNAAISLVPSANWYGRKFESRGVKQEEADVAVEEKKDKELTKVALKKMDPIVVVDDKISKNGYSNLEPEEIESIVELKEPLYIINGIYYTELELFGPNPTSPYAPLNKQQIETFSILQPEKATSIYGKKGEKGIVIITTKNGKPLPKKGE